MFYDLRISKAPPVMKPAVEMFTSFLLMFLFTVPSHCKKPEIKFAPKIVKQSSPELVFKTGESVEILCMAEGLPRATYYWKKDGSDLEINGLDVKQMPGEGTLVIQNPQLHHSGVYQCFAKSEHGTALSIKTILRKAELESFPTLYRGPEVVRPQVGKSLILKCSPPRSYPAASVYWGENKNQSKLMPILNDGRVSLDFKGNLYFANVELDDDRGGILYVCVAHNMALRIMVQGDDHKVVPYPVSGIPQVEHPRLMWSSPINDVAVRGTTKRMKCIYSGFPTPVVTWVRLDGPMPESHAYDSFGQELQITNVSYSDGGRYQCQATNVEKAQPVVNNFNLVVESPPYWRNGKPPEDVNTSVEEVAEFHCRSDGLPKPSTQWFINGVPIDELPPDTRRTHSGYTLRFANVSKSDAMVVQCNVSNPHGYIFANAFLKIVSDRPSFLIPPARITKAAHGSDVTITCKAYGAPKPEIIWQTGPDFHDVMDFDDDRFDVLENGDLSIKAVEKKDSGWYNCYLVNKLGTNASSGELVVTERTVMSKRLEDHTARAGGDITLECEASTDPEEIGNLKIEWKQDGNPVLSNSNERYKLQNNNRTLMIRNSTVSDSGMFKCLASNGIDGDESQATLVIKDVPEPPFDVGVSSCERGNALVTWKAGSDNNDRITAYDVYYNTSIDEPGVYHKVCSTNFEKCIVELRPWSSFTFHVVSKNSIGLSARSEYSMEKCITKPTTPSRHPNKVCTLSRDPNSLVVIWEPMLRTEHNGDGFHYLVSYRRRDDDYDNDENGKTSFSSERVTDWRQSELVIDGQPTYKEYVVYVEAVNDVGPAPKPANKIIGFSSEDSPIVSPTQFKILDETLNSTSVVFMWKGVDTSYENILGYFTGYEVRFWKTGDMSTVRTEKLILHEWKPCHNISEKVRRLRNLKPSTDDVHEIVTNSLWPFSSITAGVAVLNGARSSALSDVIEFDTPEGVPSMVPLFWVSERASHHLRVSWEPPYENNGVLKGYSIEYRDKEESGPYKTVVLDPLQRYKKLHNLKSSTDYVISIWAITGAGQSLEANVIEDSTTPELAPDQPIIGPIETGYDFVNISWSSGKNPRNPGRAYVVEYQKEGDSVWSETPSEDEHNWYNVTELQHGARYSFKVVAFNKNGDSMKSDKVDYVVGIKPELQSEESAYRGAALLYWLIPLVIFLFLIFLLLLLLLLFRNRGGTYPVHEKERLHGVKFDEEVTFDEFIKSENSTFKSRHGSLESSHKSSDEEEGTDSLGAYEDVDPMKFNDDGSFVDQVTLNSKPNHNYQKL